MALTKAPLQKGETVIPFGDIRRGTDTMVAVQTGVGTFLERTRRGRDQYASHLT